MRAKKYTSNRELAIVLVVITAIAFGETSGPIWSLGFLREFVTNLLGYSAISIIAIMVVAPFFHERGEDENAPLGIATHVEKQQNEKQSRKEKILEMILEKESVTNNDVESALGVSDASATNYLSELEREGKIEQVGERGRFVSYKLK